jgi:hypothetical protein
MLAAILGGSCLGIVAMLIVFAPLLRRHPSSPPEQRIEPAAFPEPSRALRCLRCGSPDLAHVPRLALLSESPPADGPLSLREPPRTVRLELVACTQCGHAEWFADSPRTLDAFRPDAAALPPRRPYRD